MNTFKKILPVGLATLLIALVSVAATTSAYQGDPDKQGPSFTPERHEAMTKAFEGKDFSAWSALKNKEARSNRTNDRINPDNFEKFAEVRQLMEAGKTEEAKALRAELGLSEAPGVSRGSRDVNRKRPENREEFRAAIENKDFNAWSAIISQNDQSSRILDHINAENFDKLIEMHELRIDGKTEEATALRAELGLPELRERVKRGEGQGVDNNRRTGERTFQQK